MSESTLSPGGAVMPALEPLDRMEVLEHLAVVPEDAPLADYLRQRLNSSKVPTCVLGSVQR